MNIEESSTNASISLMWLKAREDLIRYVQSHADELRSRRGEDKKKMVRELLAVILAFEKLSHVKQLNTQKNETQS